MNDPADNDLREPFARLRDQERSMAPVWRNPLNIRPGLQRSTEARPSFRWRPVLATLALLLGLAGWWVIPQRHTSNLVTELPQLFTPEGAPLFTSLAFTTPSMPSDDLLPAHLTLHLP